jgi:hypothetical protein
MSLFRTVETPCPVCGVGVEFEIVFSVNADRRPALRSEIMDRNFQKKPCPSCGDSFRMEPEFTYLHMGAKQFISVWPVSKLSLWGECERRAKEAFDRFYGAGAAPAAAEIGKELTVRAVFGWEALHEKLVAVEAGIDDVSLELAKILLMRNGDGPAMDDDFELRLLGIDAEQTMVIGQFATGSETLDSELTVPRALLDEIAADAEGWQALRDELTAGPFVDVARLMIPPGAALAA